MIRYTAKRNVMSSHVAGETYLFDIEFMDAQRSRQIDKTVIRAKKGRTETLYHSVDTLWALTFEPFEGARYVQMEEFLDSTSGGEEFDVWLYGDEATPIRVQRVGLDSQMSPFVRRGSRRRDVFTTQVTVRELG